MIKVLKTKGEIGFEVGGDLIHQITKWSDSVDAKVFQEQLATGRSAGHQLDPISWDILRLMASSGITKPYYGANGGSGMCFSWHFRVTASQVALTLEHEHTHETILFTEHLSQSSSAEPSGTRVLKIEGPEYARLLHWPRWDDTQALSERYEYIFAGCSLGAVRQIKDATTGELVDLTDYEDW
jgi:hypothetical protein